MTISADAIAGAQAAQKKWGVPASVSLAQYGIESGWGRFEPANSNNGFGIQALAGLPSVAAASHEFRGGQLVPVVERFAVFASVADAFDKHAELLATARAYRYAMAVANDPDKFAETMGPVYATAPHYAESLIALMHADDLYQYDVKETP